MTLRRDHIAQERQRYDATRGTIKRNQIVRERQFNNIELTG